MVAQKISNYFMQKSAFFVHFCDMVSVVSPRQHERPNERFVRPYKGLHNVSVLSVSPHQKLSPIYMHPNQRRSQGWEKCKKKKAIKSQKKSHRSASALIRIPPPKLFSGCAFDPTDQPVVQHKPLKTVLN